MLNIMQTNGFIEAVTEWVYLDKWGIQRPRKFFFQYYPGGMGYL